jgi:aldehyde dehydrogenase (NAD+)
MQYLESIVCSSSAVCLSSLAVTYTGNGVVARIIAKAAAEHLTPVTLELGGKSPVVIDPNTTNLKVAAKRVLYGKTLNAGQVSRKKHTILTNGVHHHSILRLKRSQICIAPDYVLIPRSAQDEFVEAIKEAAVELRHDNVLASDYSSIVSDSHYKRLRNMMTKSSAEIVVGGNFDEQKRRIAPTVYRDVKEDDPLLEGYDSIHARLWIGSLTCALFGLNQRDFRSYPSHPSRG